jgi:cysteine desulfuration protein SufE
MRCRTSGDRARALKTELPEPGYFPLSQSQATTIPELIETFDALGDWESQCDYLIDIGCEIPDFPASQKIEANRVHGCQSNVWLFAEVKLSNPPVIEILADSDSMIVKGLIAVLLMAYSGRTAAEILETDIKEIFSRLGLNRHLSSARRNGLVGMVKRIHAIAERALLGNARMPDDSPQGA